MNFNSFNVVASLKKGGLHVVCACMIAISALTGMQLISNEEKMLRWQPHGVFAVVLRIAANYCFHSSNFLRGHVHVGIRWQDFTGANPFKLTSLLTFFCIPQYISFNLHQSSLHIFQCDCRWCVIYLQFVFIYFSSTSLEVHDQCLTLHSGGFRFPP